MLHVTLPYALPDLFAHLEHRQYIASQAVQIMPDNGTWQSNRCCVNDFVGEKINVLKITSPRQDGSAEVEQSVPSSKTR